MGLAASQARMLMLTSRKSDIESKLQARANDLLSMSRDSQELSQEYQSALNATKLVWNENGTATDLTYSGIMKPNATSGSQYLLTNSSGAVLLDGSYASTLGLTASGNAGAIASTYPTAKSFAAKMMGVNEDQLTPVTPATGTKTDTNTPASTGIQFTTNYDEKKILDTVGYTDLNGHTDLKTWSSDHDSWGGDHTESFWGDATNNDNKTAVASTFRSAFDGTLSTIGTALVRELADQGLNKYKTQLKSAVAWAKTATFNKFIYNYNDTNSTDNNPGVDANTPIVIARGNNDNNRDNTGGNQLTYCEKRDDNRDLLNFGKDDKSRGTVYVDNSQVIDTFLTYFDQYCAQNFNGGSTAGVKGEIKAGSTSGGTGYCQRGTSDEITINGQTPEDIAAAADSSTNTVADDTINNNSLSDTRECKYYMNLYSAISAYGWQVDENMNNKNYVQNAVTYGSASVKKLQSSSFDGTTMTTAWDYLSTGDSDSPLETEADDDAVTKAKAKYDAEKDKLDFKEKMMDMDMKNLDAERSEITQEIESVNSIIKDNVKSLKMFEA